MLQDYCGIPAGMLQERCRNAAGMLQEYCRNTAEMLQECCWNAPGMLPAAGMLQKYYRNTAGMLQEYCGNDAGIRRNIVNTMEIPQNNMQLYYENHTLFRFICFGCDITLQKRKRSPWCVERPSGERFTETPFQNVRSLQRPSPIASLTSQIMRGAALARRRRLR